MFSFGSYNESQWGPKNTGLLWIESYGQTLKKCVPKEKVKQV